MKWMSVAYQLFLLKGSFVPNRVYQPCLNYCKEQWNHTISIQEAHLWKRNHYSQDTILIGHSFGGYLALLDYFANPDTVRGIVLVNSHFNSRHKQCYPAMDQSTIPIPVLTILGGRDDKLPIDISFDDFQETMDRCLEHKFYWFNLTMNHEDYFNDFTINSHNQIVLQRFIENVRRDNFTEIRHQCQENTKPFRWKLLPTFRSFIVFSNTLNWIDACAQTAIHPSLWSFIHMCMFLNFKPWSENALFVTHDSIYMKTCPTLSEDTVVNMYQTMIQKNLPSTLSLHGMIRPFGWFYPYSMSKWLFQTPSCIPSNDENEGGVQYEIYRIDFPLEITYYKFPNPNRILFQHRYDPL